MFKYMFLSLAMCIMAQQVENIEAAKILGIVCAPGRSNNIIHNSVLHSLAKRGHEVTMVTTLKQPDDAPANIRKIHVPVNTVELDKMLQKWTNKAEDNGIGLFELLSFFQQVTDVAELMVIHPDYLKIKNEQFDLVYIGWFVNDFHIGIGAHFKCPVIMSIPNRPGVFVRNYVGMPNGVSYIPSSFMSHSGPMNFQQRLVNFIAIGVETFFTVAMDYYFQDPMYQKHFPANEYPSMYEARKNISLVLVNHHFSQGVLEAYLPAMVEVGGMHIKSEPEPLPSDIKDWLDGATYGAVFFSLGSNAKSIHLSMEKRDAIMRAFSKIQLRVLWKWEDDELPNKPNNVMIKKWFPQSDILAHPNIKLFISHCGLGSVNEAKYRGVPILGIPIYGDQSKNLATIERDGWALSSPLNELNEQRFSKALNEILSNSTYRSIVGQISTLYRDRPQNPLDRAIYWIEYVIRHNGAKHMQSPAVHLNFIQYHSLDVIGFIIIVLYLCYKIAKTLLCFVFRKFQSKLIKLKNE